MLIVNEMYVTQPLFMLFRVYSVTPSARQMFFFSHNKCVHVVECLQSGLHRNTVLSITSVSGEELIQNDKKHDGPLLLSM